MGKHLDRLNPRKIVRKELLNKSTLSHRQQIHKLFQTISLPRRLALSKKFHTLLNIQSWIRLPIGVVYGLVPFSIGAGIAVGGCAGPATLGGRGSADLCALSILDGAQVMQIAPTVFQNTVRPDLRHWELLPAAIALTQASDLESESCHTGQVRGHSLVTQPLVSPPIDSN